jgi:uncharacterized damage-inducible protein DinB
MEPLRVYDYLTLARGKVFDWVRPLGQDAWSREFPIGLGSLARTLTHIMICEWAYAERIQAHELPPYETWPIQDEKPPPLETIESTWTAQAGQTRAVLAAVGDWQAQLEYRVTRNGQTTIINASVGDIFTQMTLHEVHHRAQAMNMLRQLGVKLKDIDYNYLMYKRRKV